MFLALRMFDSVLTTLVSRLSRCSEYINVHLSYSVSGFNLPEEHHCSCLSSVGSYGKGVLHQFQTAWAILKATDVVFCHI